VIIHLVDTTRSDRDAQVVDPDANGNPDDAGAMWLPGEAFVDSTNGISVSVLSATPQGFVVTVNNGSGPAVLYAVHDRDRIGNGDEQSGGHRVLGRHLLRKLPERHRRHAHPERRKPDRLGRRLHGHRHLQRDHDGQTGRPRDLFAAPDITVSPLVIEFGSAR
jgi:hypothetical protein